MLKSGSDIHFFRVGAIVYFSSDLSVLASLIVDTPFKATWRWTCIGGSAKAFTGIITARSAIE